MNTKQKLGYMVVGGLLVAVGMMAALLAVSPVTAQRDKFDTIQCSRLEVVDAAGQVMVVLDVTEYGEAVAVYGKDGGSVAELSIDEHGGGVTVFGKDEESQAGLVINKYGGVVISRGKDGKSAASLSITEHGGMLRLMAKVRVQPPWESTNTATAICPCGTRTAIGSRSKLRRGFATEIGYDHV